MNVSSCWRSVPLKKSIPSFEKVPSQVVRRIAIATEKKGGEENIKNVCFSPKMKEFCRIINILDFSTFLRPLPTWSGIRQRNENLDPYPKC
uniref:Uncharacterized protein n=1 Tax=Romanomermis culicivorax TaxID=13658 RepID=A0A915IDH7_ROMCU